MLHRMSDHNIDPPSHVIYLDQPVARRVIRHVLEGPLADPPQVYASLMQLLEYLDAEGIQDARFEDEGSSLNVKWSRTPTKKGK